jgi:hypothetical protein
MRKLITSGIAALAIAGGTLATAIPASAAPVPGTVTASTAITGRPDSGGNGNWATDSMTRTLSITRVSGTSYTATATDSAGSFATAPGDFVPNQSASPGVKFTQVIRGTFSGTASFAFTASEAPSATLVPRRATGSGPTDTSDWYKLAFPAGTVFGGAGILGTWGWSYTVQELCVTHRGPVIIISSASQVWRDFASNNGGQGPGQPEAGQVADAPPGCMALTMFP